MSNSVPPVLSLFLALEEAIASRALDGETQTMHVAAPHGDCCWEHAMERLAALEALLRRLVEEPWEEDMPVWARKQPTDDDDGWEVLCRWCRYAVTAAEWDSGKRIDHDRRCIVGDTLRLLEATNDDAE